MGFFKSFFSGKSDSPANEKQKNEQKNFEIFKYDGMRAQRMGRTDYAIKCFTEALAIQEDFETMGYLAQVYTQTNELDEAHKLLERMTEIEPEHTSTYLSLANVCYMQEDYPAMAGAAKKVDDFSEVLLQYIKDHEGFTPLNDKSAAEDIYDAFGVSKKTFKKAVGDLYKKRLVVLEAEGIRLT